MINIRMPIWLMLLLVLTFFTACTSPRYADPSQYLRQAEELMADHAFDEASARAVQALTKSSDDSEKVQAYRIMAWCAHRRGKFADAEEYWQTALRESAGYAGLALPVLMESGLGAWEKADYNLAAERFAEATESARAAGADTCPARYWHAMSLHAAGETNAALEAYRDLLPELASKPAADLVEWRVNILEEAQQ